jgi:hypothetical protein
VGKAPAKNIRVLCGVGTGAGGDPAVPAGGDSGYDRHGRPSGNRRGHRTEGATTKMMMMMMMMTMMLMMC